MVASNTIVQEDGRGRYALGWFKQWSGGNVYNSAANNRGRDNLYYFPKPEGTNPRYGWTSAYDRLAQFNATPGEENARYMTGAEKNDALAASRVPPSPEH